MNAPGTTNSAADSNAAWDAFAGTTTVTNDRPDRFFCRVCHQTWSSRAPSKSKRGAPGYNRCSHCGVCYSDDDLFRLKNPTDKFIHLIADGICVSVDRAHLPGIWANFAPYPVNVTLAREQGVDVAELAVPVATVPGIPPATGERSGADAPSSAPSTATGSAEDWEKIARSEQ